MKIARTKEEMKGRLYKYDSRGSFTPAILEERVIEAAKMLAFTDVAATSTLEDHYSCAKQVIAAVKKLGMKFYSKEELKSAAEESNVVDVTEMVEFQNNEGEVLPVMKCVCGQTFEPWNFIISTYADNPNTCHACGAKLYFSNEIRVYRVKK